MWETIFETNNVTIQSCYVVQEKKALGEIVYQLVSLDDTTGEAITMMISPHEVINIILQASHAMC